MQFPGLEVQTSIGLTHQHAQQIVR
uniref:Uncharacterized protein n=1 Tax=Anguilla anguilla TaxID=7936 RepID=A0A0E9SMI2_ANGAN